MATWEESRVLAEIVTVGTIVPERLVPLGTNVPYVFTVGERTRLARCVRRPRRTHAAVGDDANRCSRSVPTYAGEGWGEGEAVQNSDAFGSELRFTLTLISP